MHGIVEIQTKIFTVALESRENICGLSVNSCTSESDCSRVFTAVQVNRSVMAVSKEEFSAEGKIHGYKLGK